MTRRSRILYPTNAMAFVGRQYVLPKVDNAGDTWFIMTRPAGKTLGIVYATGSEIRWQTGVSQNAESGGNVGSNFYFARADDDGAYIDLPMAIYRETGNVWVAHALYADEHFEFSPDIKKDTGIENPTGDDYLDYALTDAMKPTKPYKGMYSDELVNSPLKESQAMKQTNQEAEADGVFSAQDQVDKYGKSLGKMAIGTARWAKEARQKIQNLETEVSELKQMISKVLKE